MEKVHTYALTAPEMIQMNYDNPTMTIQSLRVPRLTSRAVQQDLRSAPHLHNLRGVEMGEEHNCVVLLCEDKDTGYLAAAYLAARHGGVYRNDILDTSIAADDSIDDDEEDEAEFLVEGRLPVYPLCIIDNSFGSFFRMRQGGDAHVAIRCGRRDKADHWSEVESRHPILITPATGVIDFAAKIEEQYRMRSLTIVLLPRPKNRRGSTTEYTTDALVEELRFSCAAEVVELDAPEPDSDYSRTIFAQALRANGLALAPAADPKTILRQLAQFRARRGGAGNRNIVGLARLLALRCRTGSVQSVCELTQEQVMTLLRIEDDAPAEKRKKQTGHDLCGCENVKTQLRSVVDAMQMDRRRRAAGLKTGSHGQVLLFAGAPGTGKTTAAQMLCDWLKSEMLLDDGFGSDANCFQVSGAQLKGKYVGQTAPLVHQLFQEHSFLFIDEAYALAEAGQDNDHFAQEAMAQLCIELENLPGDHVVVFAGYGGRQNRMRVFLDANPGLASRITATVQFDAYSPDKEMPAIFAKLTADKKLTLPDGWEQVAVSYFTRRAACADYGSGREARRLLESCLTAQAHRLAGQTDTADAALCTLTAADLQEAIAALERGFTALNSAKAARYGLC